MPTEDKHHNRSKSRGQSHERSKSKSRSKSRGRGGGGGTKVVSKTVVSTPGERGRSRGRGGGHDGEQHHNKTPKPKKSIEERQADLDKERNQALLNSQAQRAHNETINEKYKQVLGQQLSETDLQAYLTEKQKIDNIMHEKTALAQGMSDDMRKTFIEKWKRQLSKRLKAWCKEKDIFIAVSKGDVAKAYFAHLRKEQANLPTLPAPPGMHSKMQHERTPAGPLSVADVDVERDDAQQSQMSYNQALWGSATQTRDRDSLRYL
jgi:hypothetical protein